MARISKAKIEEWKAALARVAAGSSVADAALDDACALVGAAGALLSEREETERALDRIATILDMKGSRADLLADGVQGAVSALGRAERSESTLLSLLREVEWVGPDAEGGWACPSCTADASVRWLPEEQRTEVIPGHHAEDCRLAQALRE